MPILDVLMVEARERMANDPAWRVNEEGKFLKRNTSRFTCHAEELIRPRITSQADALAVFAELMEDYPPPRDDLLELEQWDEDWIEWVIVLTRLVLCRHLDEG